jgi:pSer/pThr/pTyr-binding forkhead associated (FHA) protein
MQVVLIMFRADGERRSFSLPRAITVIGRREDCDLRIPLAEVSRKHCRLIIEGDALRVEDLGSSNGTYVNGHRVQEAQVEAGSSVTVGPVTFVVQIDGVPADEDIQPATSSSDTNVPVIGSDDGAVEEVGPGGTDGGGQALMEDDALELLDAPPDDEEEVVELGDDELEELDDGKKK